MAKASNEAEPAGGMAGMILSYDAFWAKFGGYLLLVSVLLVPAYGYVVWLQMQITPEFRILSNRAVAIMVIPALGTPLWVALMWRQCKKGVADHR